MEYNKIDLSDHPFISQYVDFIYEITNEESNFVYKTLPTCNIGLSITIKGGAQILRNNKWSPIPWFTIYGLTTSPQLIRMNSSFREITIGFKPYNLKHIISSELSKYAGGRTEDLSSQFKQAEIEKLRNDIIHSECHNELIQIIEKFIQGNFNTCPQSERSKKAYDSIINEELYSVKNVAENIGVSTTTLRNLFDRTIGITPKQLMKNSRINKIISQEIINSENLTQIGFNHGYFDQAHFIKDFKSVLGITPKEYFKNNNLTFDFYNFGRFTERTFTS